MDLHTVNRVRRPARAEEIASWEAGFAWLAGGTWLFSEPQVDVHTLIDLESLEWPSLQAFGGRLGDRLHVQGCGARSVRRQGAARLDGGPAVPPVLPVVSCLVQDLERGDGGRKHLHVAAGGPDDFAHGCARGRCHALAEERRTAAGVRCRFRDGQPPRMSSHPANCCDRYSCPLTRSARSSPSGGSRSRTSGDRKCC